MFFYLFFYMTHSPSQCRESENRMQHYFPSTHHDLKKDVKERCLNRVSKTWLRNFSFDLAGKFPQTCPPILEQR